MKITETTKPHTRTFDLTEVTLDEMYTLKYAIQARDIESFNSSCQEKYTHLRGKLHSEIWSAIIGYATNRGVK